MKPRLVLACLTTTDVVARARAEFDAIIPEGPDDMTVAEVDAAAAAHQAEAILFTNTLPLTAAAIAALPDSVRVGATISVGYDHIDVAAARARGIMVTNTPGVLDECTADHAMMLLLAAARRGVEYDRIMRQGWRYRIGQGDLLGVRVTGKRIGILGHGPDRPSLCAAGAGVRHEGAVSRPQPPAARTGTGRGIFRRLPRHAAALRLPVDPCARRRRDRQDDRCRALSLLPDGAVLVNVARGSLIDEDALLRCADLGQVVRRRAGRVPRRTGLRPALRRAGQRGAVAACRQRIEGNPRRDGLPCVGQHCRRAGRPARHRPALEGLTCRNPFCS